MTFPTTSVIDDFNRANGGLGSNWTAGYFGDSALTITSNQITSSVNNWGANYYNTSFGPDIEAYITVSSSPNGSKILHFRLTGSLTSSPSGYYVNFGFGTITRLDSGSETQLGASFSQSISAGDSIGVSIVGSTITVYHKSAAGSWAVVTTRTDSTYSAAGKVALEIDNNSIRLDDFGGGTVVTGGGATDATVTLTATVATSASLSKGPGKVISAAQATTAGVSKGVTRTLAATQGDTASLSKGVGKALSASLTTSASVSNQRGKLLTLTATVTTVATLSKNPGKVLVASTSTAATLNKGLTKTFSAVSATAAALLKNPGKALTATQGSSASVTNQRGRLIVLTATVSTTATMSKRVGKSLAATVTTNATVNKRIARTFAATVATIATVNKRVTRTFTAAVSLAASVTSTIQPFVPQALVNGVTGYSVRVVEYLGHSVRAVGYLGRSARNIVYRGWSQRKKD